MSEQNFEFDYDRFLRETRQAYDENVWQALREHYGPNVAEGLFNHYRHSDDPPNFQYKTSYDDKARLPYDIEGEVLDINETEWQPRYRWYVRPKLDYYAYQYKPFDEWFTLFEVSGELLYQLRIKRYFAIPDITAGIKAQIDEKRFYKIERLY